MSGNPPISPPKGLKAISIHDPADIPLPVDVIHPSEVNSNSKSVVLREVSLEQQREVNKVPEVFKSLFPLQPKEGWPKWSIDYLRALSKTRTDGEAADLIGKNRQRVWEAMKRFNDFDAVCQQVRKYRDWLLIADLERVTMNRALSGDSQDKASATLAMFHLKARDDRYKDKFSGTGGINIQINLGHPIGRSDK